MHSKHHRSRSASSMVLTSSRSVSRGRSSTRRPAGKRGRSHSGNSTLPVGTPMKMRRITARSVSKTKPKTESAGLDDLHSGVREQYQKILINKMPKGVNKRQEDIRHIWDQEQMVIANAGTQGPINLFALGTVSQWSTNSGASYGAFQAYQNWFDFNPYAKITGSGLISAGLVNQDRLLAANVTVDQWFTNLSSTPVCIDLFWCRSKTDNAKDPVTNWSDGLVQQGLSQPILTRITAGTAGSASGTIGYADASLPYTYPRTPLFKKFWKVVRHNRIQLAGAADHHLKSVVELNHLGKKEYILELLDKSVVFPKGCVVQIMVVNGVPIHEAASGDAADTITFSSSRVATITRCNLRFKTIKQNAQRVAFEDDVARMHINASIADQKITNVVDTVSSVVQS